MLKGVVGLLGIVLVASSPLAYAQQASRPSQADLSALTDAQGGIATDARSSKVLAAGGVGDTRQGADTLRPDCSGDGTAEPAG